MAQKMTFPYFEFISAGFPSPADDYMDKELNLHEYLIQHPAATFLLRVQGDSMLGAGIFPNDILVVDRSLQVQHKDVVIAILEGEFTVKRYVLSKGKHWLCAENPDYQPIDLSRYPDCIIWGIVTFVVHKTSRI